MHLKFLNTTVILILISTTLPFYPLVCICNKRSWENSLIFSKKEELANLFLLAKNTRCAFSLLLWTTVSPCMNSKQEAPALEERKSTPPSPLLSNKQSWHLTCKKKDEDRVKMEEAVMTEGGGGGGWRQFLWHLKSLIFFTYSCVMTGAVSRTNTVLLSCLQAPPGLQHRQGTQR